MMFQILLNHLLGYIPCTPNSITYCPKVTPPIFFAQKGKFLLK
jgi:hypothetical protein